MSPALTTENVDWIIERWPHLLESRLKGTPRPWKQPDITPEQRAEIDHRAREEKLQRGAFVLGESPAPVHLDVLDKAQAFALKIQSLALLVSDELQHNVTRHRNPDAITLLLYIRGHLNKVSNDTWNKARKITAEVRAGMALHFTEVFDGQRLKTDCPWCTKPRLFIRMIGPETNPQPVVVCESGVCEPPSADCGTYWRGKPAWPFFEWEWLSQRLHHEEEKTAS